MVSQNSSRSDNHVAAASRKLTEIFGQKVTMEDVER